MPTFYEKQIMWKKGRESVLENERRMREKERNEEDENCRKPIRAPKKYTRCSSSRMETIIDDLNRVSAILDELQ
jgi:hypothetical protein